MRPCFAMNESPHAADVKAKFTGDCALIASMCNALANLAHLIGGQFRVPITFAARWVGAESGVRSSAVASLARAVGVVVSRGA